MLAVALLTLFLLLPAAVNADPEDRLARYLTGGHPLFACARTGEAKLYRVSLNGTSGRFLWAGDRRARQIALTFDDGPSPVITPQVLKILEDNGVRATFFLIGRNAQRHPELVRQIHAAGHALGNHTFSHVKLPRAAADALNPELDRTREVIRELTDTDTRLFRPPFGAFDGRLLGQFVSRDLDVVFWSVDSRDWTGAAAASVTHNVLSGVHNGAVVLCHDGHGGIVPALPGIIRKLKEDGYGFVTIPQMMDTAEAPPAEGPLVAHLVDLPWTPAMWRLP
jgi:peptidoglycan/xylan/chitin deacetylase (PgdA/CDA1 family)